MSDQRPTVRPVTLARLVEITDACLNSSQTMSNLEEQFDTTERRLRSIVLESLRLDLIRTLQSTDDGRDDEVDRYRVTTVGEQFHEAVTDEDWRQVSSILETRSPHYGAFLSVLEEIQPAELQTLLAELEDRNEHTPYAFNQTGVEVVGDWAERLGVIQRNAFTGTYYVVDRSTVPPNFPFVLLAVFDELEERTGVNLSQRYVSIPELREFLCERVRCDRDAFDTGLTTLVGQNIGKLELLGAPTDTGAKDAEWGIKQIRLADDEEGLVTTTHSTEQVMAGVEQYGKRYYYLAVHDDAVTFDPEP
ncbi:hypothetical protein [Natronobacterium texcoconense]|uniref:Uncharacterized protein n=1 Tax=Natronobacterium texcoconense TaxID=1095778 RepID=A0A1H1AJ15_NATTX|nr:hypothetical protein [Natronobacterium texcoconense]SDQ39763.1 hypothetical protein SAMN04489842_0714 [Natronobacterium texcoconense]